MDIETNNFVKLTNFLLIQLILSFRVLVLLDFSKAFDMVDHDILLSKLKTYGIVNNVLKLFKSYLQNRKQFTVVGDAESTKAIIKSGVPQGSIIGPILFLIYANDISHLNLKGQLTLYADDTALFYYGKMEDLNKIALWKSQNKMKLNEKNATI